MAQPLMIGLQLYPPALLLFHIRGTGRCKGVVCQQAAVVHKMMDTNLEI